MGICSPPQAALRGKAPAGALPLADSLPGAATTGDPIGDQLSPARASASSSWLMLDRLRMPALVAFSHSSALASDRSDWEREVPDELVARFFAAGFFPVVFALVQEELAFSLGVLRTAGLLHGRAKGLYQVHDAGGPGGRLGLLQGFARGIGLDQRPDLLLERVVEVFRVPVGGEGVDELVARLHLRRGRLRLARQVGDLLAGSRISSAQCRVCRVNRPSSAFSATRYSRPRITNVAMPALLDSARARCSKAYTMPYCSQGGPDLLRQDVLPRAPGLGSRTRPRTVAVPSASRSRLRPFHSDRKAGRLLEQETGVDTVEQSHRMLGVRR